jgi:ABC-type antimicrobial peptide transport system permease subunit
MTAVITRSVRIALMGAAAGLVISVIGARVIQSLLFATDARDPKTLLAVSGLLVFAAVTACAVPAIKASRVDPMATLRAE